MLSLLRARRVVVVAFAGSMFASATFAQASTAPAEVPLCSGTDTAAQLAASQEGKALYEEATRTTPIDRTRMQAALDAFDRQCAAGDGYALELRARALSALGRTLEAAKSMDEFLLQFPLPMVPTDVKLRVEQDSPRILAQVGTIRIKTNAFKATVRIDGGAELALVELPFRVEPGQHRVWVAAPGFHAQERELTLHAGGTVELDLVLRPAYVAAPSKAGTDDEPIPATRRDETDRQDAHTNLQPYAWIAAGAAVLAVGTGIAGTAMSFSAADEYGAQDCTRLNTDACAETRDRFNLGRTLELAGFVAGGVFAATAAILFVLDASGPPQDEVSTALGCTTAPGAGLALSCRYAL